jgi:cell division protein FtsB
MILHGNYSCQCLKNQHKTTVNRTMKIFKYFVAFWISVAVYTVFTFFYGQGGLSAYNQLLSEREQQMTNIKDLWALNEELEKTKNNLLYDYDTLLVYARQMGYGYEDERFVRIVGLGNTKNSPAAAGKIYKLKAPDFIPDKNIKISALCAGLLVFAFMFMLEIIETRTR